jgi:hypothetical protein
MKWQLNILYHRISWEGTQIFSRKVFEKGRNVAFSWYFSSFTWRECEVGTDTAAVNYRTAKYGFLLNKALEQDWPTST